MAYWKSTKAKPGNCSICKSAIVTAMVEGRLCNVDAQAITAIGEYLARINGRMSYELWRGELLERDEYRVRANRPVGPILAEHRCATIIAPQYRASLTTPIRKKASPDTPPY